MFKRRELAEHEAGGRFGDERAKKREEDEETAMAPVECISS